MRNPFVAVEGFQPGRSVFPLNHTVKGDIDMGKLYPVFAEDCVPGDVWDIGVQLVLRFHQPLFAPLLHEVNAFVHVWFVPYRILWEHGKLRPGRTEDSATAFSGDFETYLSGGVDGTVTLALPYESMASLGLYSSALVAGQTPGSLGDWLYSVTGGAVGGAVTGSEAPPLLTRLAYLRIFNEHYRDENLIDEVGLSDAASRFPLLRAWEPDYFTKALPWQQKGTAPAIGIAGVTNAEWATGSFDDTSSPLSPISVKNTLSDNHAFISSGAGTSEKAMFKANAEAFMNNNVVDGAAFSGVDASDLRQLFQLQKWLERNARAGSRFNELVRGHFGVDPGDARLNRPEFVGGSRQPVVFSEVLQTSESGTTPQGHLAGHGISASGQRVGRYRVREPGVLMGIVSVMPRTGYQQGFDRMHLKDSKFDYVWPEFAHLSEQPVYLEEVYAKASSGGRNRVIFGYQGRYNEYRYRKSRVCGTLRSDAAGSLDYWHLDRYFDSEPGLNEAFVSCSPRTDIFPVPSAPGMLMQVGNNLRVARPLPASPEPGLLDHF